ncbi:MAG: hypothetical protein EKD82_17540 [Candidatus Symbiopectobacterium sp. PLON1]|nr:hypothetical protein [Candidatus Symbiopectobacterium sp. PLON1]
MAESECTPMSLVKQVIRVSECSQRTCNLKYVGYMWLKKATYTIDTVSARNNPKSRNFASDLPTLRGQAHTSFDALNDSVKTVHCSPLPFSSNNNV